MEFFNQIVNLITFLFDFIIHVDQHLADLMNQFGRWLYPILFGIVFCETGLVVTPFLPGDSLLFAAGALAAIEGSPISIVIIIPLIIAAALCGDMTNYSVGRHLGPAVFSRKDSLLLNQIHLLRAQDFYKKHGVRTIVLARFVPIVRTFVPFIAGIGRMELTQYVKFCIVGAVLWVSSFTTAGYVFGNIPVIKRNFHIVIIAIVLISIFPMIKEFWGSPIPKLPNKNNRL